MSLKKRLDNSKSKYSFSAFCGGASYFVKLIKHINNINISKNISQIISIINLS